MAAFFILFNLIVWRIESQYIVFRRIWADPLSPYEAYRYGNDLILSKDSAYYWVREGKRTERVQPDGYGGGIKFLKGQIRTHQNPDKSWSKPSTVKNDIWDIWIVHEDGSREKLSLWISPKEWD